MIENLDILYNVTGQSLVFDAPEGRASSIVSSQVFESISGDDGNEESALSGSAAVETNPNTTFDANSGDGQADPTVLNIAATTGIAKGRRYLATNANGESDLVEVIDIVSATSVQSRHPLKNAYASGDSFVSTRISHAIDSTWIADRNNISDLNDPSARYRWRLVYVVDSVTYAQHIFFDVVRYSPGSTVSGLDVDLAFPGWLDSLPVEHRQDQGDALIREAYRAVKLDMYQAGKADQMARNRELVDDLVIQKAGQLAIHGLLIRGAQVDPQSLALIDQRYTERFTNYVVNPKLKFDNANAGGSAMTSSAPVWRR